eukprot:TRINITY_DN4824_c0_g1_i4.p2 TRINITY_DN4824_c0_g1~~TRINITY_DN4824_c0_g1_i4.p2  ORF type:complete len:367 (+),score=46.23 TRINITY_DN4824_c0_g1_i4:227-1327(+)
MVLGLGVLLNVGRQQRKREKGELVVVASATTSSLSKAASEQTAQFTTKPASDVLAGAMARAASQSTIHPIDTLKVRLQHKGAGGVVLINQSPMAKKRVALLCRSPVRLMDRLSRGLRSLYRGVGGAATGAGIAIGAYFAFYSVACNFLNNQTSLPPGGVAFVGGAVAAAGSSVVKVPLAVCIRSVQAGVYQNVFSAASQITKAAGPRGLFTGYLPTLLEDVPDMAFKFAAYESLRGIHKIIIKDRQASVQEDFVMGAIAGAFAAAVTTPLDAIKTGMMCSAASKPSMISVARKIYQNGGLKAFLNGLGPRAISNGVNSAVFFCFFEAIRSFIQQQQIQQQQKQQQLLIQNKSSFSSENQSVQLQLQ